MPLFVHNHPYPIFIPAGSRKIIVGTLPPPRFSTGKLRENDVNFCYGSSDNMLWPILAGLYNLNLRYDNSAEAVTQRKTFLRKERLGIADIVGSCVRAKVDASDLGMKEIILRNLLRQLELCTTLKTVIFMGGNSQNGPEYLFRRQLKGAGLLLRRVPPDRLPRRHLFHYAGRQITTVSLISPSRAANRAIGSSELYKKRKKRHPSYNTFLFRLDQYRPVFMGTD